MKKNTNDTVDIKEYMDVKFSNIEKNTEIARDSMNERLKGMNEFRDQLKDQASRFITRAELEAIINKLDADIRVLRDSKNLLEGKASQQSVNTAFIFSAIGIFFGIIGIVMRFL